MPIRAKLDATGTFKTSEVHGEAPLTASDIVCQTAEALAASGIPGHALKAGVPAPGFNLCDTDGHAVSLSGALASGPVVVTFHGALWCPTCTMDLRTLEAVLPEYLGHGATLLAISPQTPAHNRATRDKVGASFPLLADPRNRVAAAYGLLVKLPAALINLYPRSGIDLPTLNGDESWTLPLSARFVIARDRTIDYAEVSADLSRRFDPTELLPVLRRASRPV